MPPPLPLRWIALHVMPLVIIPLLAHTVGRLIGLNAAAALTHLVVLTTISTGQAALLPRDGSSPSRWGWQTACGLGCALAAGLVVMSTIDLAGYDALATVVSMTVVGLVLSAFQAPLRRTQRYAWATATTLGWFVAAIAFRASILRLTRWSVFGLEPYGTVYAVGHNELLWSAVGLAFYGLCTARIAGLRTAPASPGGSERSAVSE